MGADFDTPICVTADKTTGVNTDADFDTPISTTELKTGMD
jgi:hypothetical protein